MLRDPLQHVKSLLLNAYTNTLDYISRKPSEDPALA
jgi:hypothetical protein